MTWVLIPLSPPNNFGLMCNCLNCNYTTATIISLFKLVLCFWLFLRPLWRPRNASGDTFWRRQYFKENWAIWTGSLKISRSLTVEFAWIAGYASLLEGRFNWAFYRQSLNSSWILPLSSCYYKLDKNPLGAFPVDGSEYGFQQLCILIAVEPECYSLFFRLASEMFLDFF